MTETIIQEICQDCNGKGFHSPQGVLDDRFVCLSCKGTGIRNDECPPIVTLSPSSFVEALGAQQGDKTVLDIMEQIVSYGHRSSGLKCGICDGTGKVVDPFADGDNDLEDCITCGGEGRVFRVSLPISLAKAFPLLNTALIDLRAALNSAKGEPL